MNERKKEILERVKEFAIGEYYHGEEVEEIKKLIQAVVSTTFDADHANASNLNLYDVYKHMEQMNTDCGNIADDELKKFERMNRDLHNYLKGLISGEDGERKAEKYINYAKLDKRMLKNIELESNGMRNELDFVVITPRCVTVVEVKNTKKDVFISEDGKQYRMGEFNELDCAIEEKLNLKESLLRNTLGKEYKDITVNKILLFTNHKIKVQNKCKSITVSFPDQLPYLIDEFENEAKDSIDMESIENMIKHSNNKKKYPINFEVEEYKSTFASLLALLEEASLMKDTDESNTLENIDNVIQNNNENLEMIKELRERKRELEQTLNEYENKCEIKRKKYYFLGIGMAALSFMSTISTLILTGLLMKQR